MRFNPVTKPIPLKAVAIDALDCQQLDNASRISTTPSRLPSPGISLHSSSSSRHRNGDSPLARLAKNEEPGCTSREARSGGGLDEMTRRKREIIGLRNEQDFPRLVELPLPPEGFRSVLLEIDAFHRER